MEHVLLAYGLPNEIVAVIMMRYRNTKVKVHSSYGDTDFFNMTAGVLHGDTLFPYPFITYLDYVLWTTIDLMKENGFTLKKRKEADNTYRKLSRTQTTQMTERFLQIHQSSQIPAA